MQSKVKEKIKGGVKDTIKEIREIIEHQIKMIEEHPRGAFFIIFVLINLVFNIIPIVILILILGLVLSKILNFKSKNEDIIDV